MLRITKVLIYVMFRLIFSFFGINWLNIVIMATGISDTNMIAGYPIQAK